MARLSLQYNADIPGAMIDLLEHHARKVGLPLAAVERIGQELELVEEFILAAENGKALEFGDFVLGRDPAPRTTERPAPRSGPAAARVGPSRLRQKV